MDKEGNGETNEGSESVQNHESNVIILQDCENKQDENSRTRCLFKMGDQDKYNLEEKIELT